MKIYKWMDEAESAIREHFQNRDRARAIKGRVYVKKTFVDILPTGDMVYSFSHKGEMVTATQCAYDVKVNYEVRNV
jgi:hypothetical protein